MNEVSQLLEDHVSSAIMQTREMVIVNDAAPVVSIKPITGRRALKARLAGKALEPGTNGRVKDSRGTEYLARGSTLVRVFNAAHGRIRASKKLRRDIRQRFNQYVEKNK